MMKEAPITIWFPKMGLLNKYNIQKLSVGVFPRNIHRYVFLGIFDDDKQYEFKLYNDSARNEPLPESVFMTNLVFV